ncbi:hypothetical protein BdWA1_000466 [Babesia duncani]|uniref:Uncharacterized protein n=1 Tax=Babesia duncani TaxID=323732 RepID=A0AAD9PMU8_9APIC|nr:hypothetical protein BdWA1_000466 [Babesia duncani]
MMRSYIHALRQIDPARFTLDRIAERYGFKTSTVAAIERRVSLEMFVRRNRLCNVKDMRITLANARLDVKEESYRDLVGTFEFFLNILGYILTGDERGLDDDFQGDKMAQDWVQLQSIKVESLSAFPLPSTRFAQIEFKIPGTPCQSAWMWTLSWPIPNTPKLSIGSTPENASSFKIAHEPTCNSPASRRQALTRLVALCYSSSWDQMEPSSCSRSLSEKGASSSMSSWWSTSGRLIPLDECDFTFLDSTSKSLKESYSSTSLGGKRMGSSLYLRTRPIARFEQLTCSKGLVNPSLKFSNCLDNRRVLKLYRVLAMRVKNLGGTMEPIACPLL